LGHAQLRLRRGEPCGRGIKLGLLLGRIESRKNVTAVNTGTDIYQPRNHAATDPKREVGAVARLDFAGQRERSLSVLRLHNFGAYERGTLHRIGGVVVAGAQWRRQKRDREYGIPMPQQRGRMG
jgi:hypothetical protein